MKSSIYRSVVITVTLFLSSSVWSAPVEHSDIDAGNSKYKDGDYASAEKDYRKALDKAPASFMANFNMGDALYKKEEYKAARDYYKAAYGKDNTDEQNAAVMHNIGNTLMKEGNYGEAVNSYKESLKLNPDDNDTRYNLSLAQRLLQQQQDQQNQQQKNNEQQQEQNPDPNQQDGREEENHDNTQNAPQRESSLDQNSARQLLDALEQDEKDKQKDMMKDMMKKNSQRMRIEKQW